MINPNTRKRGGGASMMLLLCGTAGGVGLAFDFLVDHRPAFWLMGEPGGRALLGLGVAVAAIVVARLWRVVLARSIEDGEGRDARHHS